jgi:hypothetical protein
MASILFKILLAVATGLLGAWALQARAFATLSERAFLWRTVALYLVPALGLFLAVYIAGGQEVTSDVPGYYLPVARAVLTGQVPFRDFALSYAPLFPYAGALVISVWNSGKAFALLAILLSALALILWHSTASACLDRQTARQSSILCATSGHMIVQGLLGTNQAWIGAALAGSAWALVHNRSAVSGLLQALAACMTKVLVLLFWPVLWIFAPRRSWWLAAAAPASAAVYVAFWAAGADILYPLRFEGDLITSGNLPYLLDPLVGEAAGTSHLIFDGLALLALAATVIWLYFRTRPLPALRRPMSLLPSLALVGLVFMLFSKKSYTGYAVFFMYPMILALVAGTSAGRTRIGFLLAFNTLLIAEPSLWFRLGGFEGPLSVWLRTDGGLAAGGFVLVDLALIVCYVYLAWLSVLCVQRTVDGAMTSRNASQSDTACSLV